ncbi:MAG: hypothetical protein HUU14_05355 [Dehalococcoidia bacterium]|nr:hypothetical protein [Chloroflexi bacterium CFX7]MCK6563715.1 hypothetical protein [Dehalococcoidia bacterium]NUQ55295.1 hypothetical protein [Dehalococcoidia bacterium]RIL04144.1 MAG: hypothetical protein DCC78_00730 [bacterium]
MLFDAIFLTLFVTGWALCGLAPWLALSVWTRGAAGLHYLPLAVFTGVVGGLAVPILGREDATGIWLSFIVAVAAPTLLLAARRFSLGGLPHAGVRGKPTE